MKHFSKIHRASVSNFLIYMYDLNMKISNVKAGYEQSLLGKHHTTYDIVLLILLLPLHTTISHYCNPSSIMKVVIGDSTRWRERAMSPPSLSLGVNVSSNDVYFFSVSGVISPRILSLQSNHSSVAEVLLMLGVDPLLNNVALACNDKILRNDIPNIFQSGITRGDNVKLVFLHERRDTCAIADVYSHGLFRIYVEVDHDTIVSIDVYPFLRASDVIDSLIQHPVVDHKEGSSLMLLFGGNVIEYENNHCLCDLHVEKDSHLYLAMSHFSSH